MPYCTLADIRERIPDKVIIQLTDDARTGDIDAARVAAAIARADGEIDAWCGTRYRVPFATAPPVIGQLSADMAVYHLYARKAEKIPDTRAAGYKNAVELLKEISRGNVSLGAEGTAEGRTGGGAAVVGGGGRRLTRDTLEGGF
jgi:phage gp36-like protein